MVYGMTTTYDALSVTPDLLSSRELRITEPQRSALIALLGKFQRNEIPTELDMTRWDTCLYEQASRIDRLAFPPSRSYWERPPGFMDLPVDLQCLFCPYKWHKYRLGSITAALQNYLTTGKPCWEWWLGLDYDN